MEKCDPLCPAAVGRAVVGCGSLRIERPGSGPSSALRHPVDLGRLPCTIIGDPDDQETGFTP